MPWAPEYIDADDLKGFIRVGDVLDDAELVLMAAAANRVVDRAAGRQFGSVAAEARSYPVRYDRRLGRWVAEVDDLQSDVGAVYPSGVDPPTLWPRNAVSVGLAWTHMRWTADPSDDDGMVTVTAAWGWTTVPPAVPLAARLQGSRFVARRESPFGIAGSPDQGSELRLLARADPDVVVALAYYRRTWWAR